ncbi:MAG: carboxypeptidase regulatory-like domain-containing protein [Phormidium sp. GEM2.Bin31]|nr:carboxypeptidase regulatory-like domain-containing protein [Phormidium sp. BM_Day4_Bin.17]TVR11137.1 MAG: carboxypeptidase regulatory-like domain-containing protein [Phormidium sp. GEM2.Bin31]UCJ12083.1 MAG: carboxypeptidase regulatory-like domain-containing protein [Phormidium sp. PBR-2020]
MKSLNWTLIIPIVGLGVIGVTETALAHAAQLRYEIESTISVTATYDNGEPMANAQILIYSPDDAREPWMRGTTDDAGRYEFRPQAEESGNWTVTVRQAGHGDMITINLDDSGTRADASTENSSDSSLFAGSADISLPQRLLTGGSIIWGCVGTALFFSRRRKSSSES